MKIRVLTVPFLICTATLAPLCAQAQDGPPRTGGFGALPGDGAPRPEGGPREGGPREGGPREGGPAAPRNNGPREGETPEQYRNRVLARYIEAIPELTEPQKVHMMAILDAVNLEAAAIVANTTLTPERRTAVSRALRASTSTRIQAALTEEQAAEYQKMLDERAEATADMQKLGTVRPTEDFEKLRERVLKGYEEVLEELSVKQKTDIIKILEQAGEESATIEADTAKSKAEKTAALIKIHSAIDAKVSPLLDDDQRATWKKAHAAKLPK